MATGINAIDRIPPVTRALLIINIAIWLVMAFSPSINEKLTNFGGLHYFTSPGFNPAQLITYMFVHAGFTHVFFNMFALFFFGPPLENALGRPRYLFLYISCGIGAALIQEGVFAIEVSSLMDKVDALMPGMAQQVIDEGWAPMLQGYNFSNPLLAQLNVMVNGATVGASGAVFGLLLAFAMLWPNVPMYIMFIPVPIKAKWMVAGYAAIELLCGLGSYMSNVAHFAHLGGMIFAFFIIWYWRRQARG